MQRRLLLACVVALAVMLLCSLVIQVFASPLNQALDTPLGALPLADVFSVVIAMAIGAFVARQRGFRWVAIGLVTVVWLATLSAMMLGLPPKAATSAPAATVLEYNALTILVTLGAAWLGAWIGNRLAMRRYRPIVIA